MTKTTSNMIAVAAAVVLTALTFQQTIAVPASANAPFATAQLA